MNHAEQSSLFHTEGQTHLIEDGVNQKIEEEMSRRVKVYGDGEHGKYH